MHLAAWEGHVACIRALHALGARADVMSAKKMTPLMAAAENGRADIIDELAKMIDPKYGMDTKNQLNMTAMHLAAKYNHKDCILALDRYKATADFHSLVYSRYYGDPESDDSYDCVVVLAQLLQRPKVKDRVWVKINGVMCSGTVVGIDESVHPIFVNFEQGVESYGCDGWFPSQVRLNFFMSLGDGAVHCNFAMNFCRTTEVPGA